MEKREYNDLPEGRKAACVKAKVEAKDVQAVDEDGASFTVWSRDKGPIVVSKSDLAAVADAKK